MKLLWYWYVMRGAGSTLETQEISDGNDQLRKQNKFTVGCSVKIDKGK